MWIILLKKWVLGFPKVKWYSILVRWANVLGIDIKFSEDLLHQNSLKLVNFWRSYSKNKKGDVFWHTVYTWLMCCCGLFCVITSVTVCQAMHHLGIATTRAGSCITSDSAVVRDIFYNGNPVSEQCSVITRIAPSFIRYTSPSFAVT